MRIISLIKGNFCLIIARSLSELFLFAAEGVNFTRSTTRITGEHPVAPKGDEGKLQIVITLLQCTGKLHTIVILLQYTGMLQTVYTILQCASKLQAIVTILHFTG